MFNKLNHKEMWIKMTVRFYLTPIRMAVVHDNKQQMMVMMWGKGTLHAAGGNGI
jgi:hypothetical protein